jgi:tripeptide aminopeptidase
MIAAMALVDAQAGGWFGKVVKGDKAGTSNVGTVAGRDGRGAGDATNVVTDYCYVEGESRSHDMAFVDAITDAFEAGFVKAAATLVSSEGKTGRVEFKRQRKYHSFAIDRNAPVVQRGIQAIEAIGLTPNPRLVNGGLDANYLTLHGIQTVTFGAGQNEAHTVDEWVDIPAFQNACRLAIAWRRRADAHEPGCRRSTGGARPNQNRAADARPQGSSVHGPSAPLSRRLSRRAHHLPRGRDPRSRRPAPLH